MRAIKFRVWDKGRGEWLHKHPFHLFGETVLMAGIDRRNDGTHVRLEELNDLMVMQYTGLKDRNGVEWCEGDILGLVDDEKDKSRCEIIFEDGAFRRYWRHGCDDGEPFSNSITPFDLGFWKVIGNIYEHPELIKCT